MQPSHSFAWSLRPEQRWFLHLRLQWNSVCSPRFFAVTNDKTHGQSFNSTLLVDLHHKSFTLGPLMKNMFSGFNMTYAYLENQCRRAASFNDETIWFYFTSQKNWFLHQRHQYDFHNILMKHFKQISSNFMDNKKNMKTIKVNIFTRF